MSSGKVIAKNLASLGLLQVTNYLVPVIAIPILLSRIGLDQYGVITLAQGIMNILVAVTDFGLNLTGTRLISHAIEDKREQTKIAFKVYSIKLTLLVVVFIGLFCLVGLVPAWSEHQAIILSSYLIVIGNTLLPVWYFQGIQKMKWLTLFNFISRVGYLIMILILIKSPEDFVLVNVLNGLAWCIAAVIAVVLMSRRLNFTLVPSSPSEILKFMKSNTSIFLSIASGTGYRNASIIVAGFFLNGYWLGIYGIIDKILMLIINSYSILFRAIFPTLCQLIKDRTQSIRVFMLKTFGRLVLLVLPGIGVFYLFGAEVISWLSEEIQRTELIPFMGIMSLVPLMLFLNLPVSLLIIGYDLKRQYLLYNAAALITVAISSPLLTEIYSTSGLIYGLLSAEATMILVGSAILWKKTSIKNVVVQTR